MTRWLNSADSSFEAEFVRLLGDKREQAADVNDAVAAILDDVRQRGDAAVRQYTSQFDGFDLPEAGARMSADQIDREADKCPADIMTALAAAADRIRAYHERQVPDSDRYTDEQGVELGHRWTPVQAAGLYVPGGLAARARRRGGDGRTSRRRAGLSHHRGARLRSAGR